MAFVNEPVGEAGRELIRSLNLSTPPGYGGGLFADYYLPLERSIWTIDHDRHLQYFVMCGIGFGDREQPPLYCCLIWHGNPIKIEARELGCGNNTVGIQELWEIEKILVPSELKNIPEKEIIEAIKEAFVTYAHRRERNIKTVEFSYIPQVKYAYKVGELK